MSREPTTCADCGTGPIMGLDTPSGVLCSECAAESHAESDCTPRSTQ